ncbi:hypothetical protein BGX27_004200 [Mortierella sp. AM989]|nr:hypothetical protein BGX27_004200 [Mortierella sp. AM989]
MHLNISKKYLSDRAGVRNKRMSWSILSTLTILITLLSISLSPSSTQVSAAPLVPGFCGDCQTFANAIQPCGETFAPANIEITGNYVIPQTAAKCICSDVMQSVLWTCSRCEQLNGFAVKTDPPQKYQTTCMGWGITIDQWKAPYTGAVAPGTTTPINGAVVPPGQPSSGTATGSVPSTNGTGTAPATPSGSNGTSTDTESSGGLNGTAIGISLGIIGVAVLGGAVAMFMMKRSRRRHEPLDLDGTYVGLDDQWEKPRPQSPASIPAPAPITARGPARPSPFESRPGGGGSVVGGYDGQYEQYEQYDNQYPPQYPNGYGYQGQGHQGYGGAGGHDYGYEHTVPTSAPYHAKKAGSEVGGQYL